MLLSQQGLILIFGIVFVWLAVLSVFLFQAVVHYRKLTAGTNREDLQSVLEKILAEQGVEVRRVDEILKRVERVEEEGLVHVQKIGLVRFNPFSGTGGDQSFALAVLDGQSSGFVFSSLHSRDATRIYAKEVKDGKPIRYQFSKEESEAIQKAKRLS